MKLQHALAFAALLCSGAVLARDFDAGSLHIANPHARPTIADRPMSAAYFTVENRGKTADRLLGASSPAAQSIEVHSMAMEGTVMKMREVQDVMIKPGETVALEPGKNYHLMLLGLRQPLKPGDAFPLILKFEKAGNVDVSVIVDGNQAGHNHMH